MNNQPIEECCPRFDPAPWMGKLIKWEHKRFITDRAMTFMYIPLNFGGVMKRLNNKIVAAGAENPDYLCLSEHESPWKMKFYLAVNKEVPGVENIQLSGKYLSNVYEGGFQDTEKWMKDFESFAQSKKLRIENLYMWYTTCPKCAKKFGKNYVVIIAKVLNGGD